MSGDDIDWNDALDFEEVDDLTPEEEEALAAWVLEDMARMANTLTDLIERVAEVGRQGRALIAAWDLRKINEHADLQQFDAEMDRWHG